MYASVGSKREINQKRKRCYERSIKKGEGASLPGWEVERPASPAPLPSPAIELIKDLVNYDVCPALLKGLVALLIPSWQVGVTQVTAGGLLFAVASLIVEHWLSCSEACGILLDQGSNLCPLHW